ncbi:MAG: hypothetical protein M0031_07885 [Thermaerobacter sp.]|nr:hypothetical protein [Thermaerobacter sp.]
MLGLFGGWQKRCLLYSVALVIFAAIALAVGHDGLFYWNSDPDGISVVSLNMIQRGSVVLNKKEADFFGKSNYRIDKLGNAEEVYAYPVGTALFLAPIVLTFHSLGRSPYKWDKDIQRVGVVVLSFAILLTLFAIYSRYVVTVWSYALTVLTFFGTLVGPTVGGALWSIDLAIAIMGVCILLIVGGKDSGGWLVVIAILLWLGYVTRPSFALFIAGIFLYYALQRNFKALIISGLTSGLLLFLFVVWSYHNYHSMLPPYYMQASRLSLAGAEQALSGLLFSASRSVIIYSPIVAVAAWLLVKRTKFLITQCTANNELECRIKDSAPVSKDDMLLVGMGIPFFGVFILNVFWPMWWAGGSYGPRILTSMAYLGAVISVISCSREEKRSFWLKAILTLLLIGVPISLQGMYNSATSAWLGVPSSNGLYQPETVWSYRYPQWLASNASLLSMCRDEARILKTTCDNVPSDVLFEELGAGVKKYLSYGGKDGDVWPSVLEKQGDLPRAYGSESGAAKNWTANGGWLGNWGNGSVGIGVKGKYNDVIGIIKRYGKTASVVFYPYPRVFHYHSAEKRGVNGLLLMVFSEAQINKDF